MIRAVADTNILISALVFGGVPAIFLDLALAGSFQLISSPVLLDELSDKLHTKFELPFEDVTRIRVRLESAAIIVSPAISLKSLKTIPMTTASSSAQYRVGPIGSSAAIDIYSSSAHTKQFRFSPFDSSWTSLIYWHKLPTY